MKKSILNLGKALNKAEQKKINGGLLINCYDNPTCPPYNAVACAIIGGTCKYFCIENDLKGC